MCSGLCYGNVVCFSDDGRFGSKRTDIELNVEGIGGDGEKYRIGFRWRIRNFFFFSGCRTFEYFFRDRYVVYFRFFGKVLK